MTNDSPVAVVTGASRGIGRALAIRLATDGFDVAGTWNRDEKAADETKSRVEGLGRRCLMYRSDVSDPSATTSLVEQVASDCGKVDAVVHNAGIASRGRFVSDTEPSEIQRVLAVHALGAFYLCSGLAPIVRKSTRGSIVLISSIATSNPSPGGAPYMMGKAALEALAQTLGLEERTYGTRVNVVAPGLVATDMGDRLARALTGADDAASLDGAMPFGRVTRPEDVADLVSFLVSDASAQVTGQRVEIHGGKPEVTR